MLTPLTGSDPRAVGRFQLQGRLGAGGMGVVYLGFGPGGQAAAIKMISPGMIDDPEFRARFRREVEAARRVQGGCVARLLDADPDGEPPWMATEYVDGVSLAEAVSRRGRLHGATLTTLAVGLADGLVAVHAAGLVHRDLKPANVLLSWDGPKIIDFGIVRDTETNAHADTRTGALLGTAAWMAPEQLRGERVGPAVDVFAWAMCIAYAARGRHPFPADTPAASAIRVLQEAPDLTGVPAGLHHVLARALDRDPGRRPTAVGLVSLLVGREMSDAADADVATRRLLAGWVLPSTSPRQPAPQPQPPQAQPPQAQPPQAQPPTPPVPARQTPARQTPARQTPAPRMPTMPAPVEVEPALAAGAAARPAPAPWANSPAVGHRSSRRRAAALFGAGLAVLLGALGTVGWALAANGGDDGDGNPGRPAAIGVSPDVASAGPGGVPTPVSTTGRHTPSASSAPSAVPRAGDGVLPRATMLGRPLGPGVRATVHTRGGLLVPTYHGPAVSSRYAGRRGSLLGGVSVTMYCAVYGGSVTAGGTTSRLWNYTSAGWVNDVYTLTGTTGPVVPACAGNVANPQRGDSQPRSNAGPFMVVTSAGSLSVRARAGLQAPVTGVLHPGDLVTLICSVRSTTVSPPPGLVANSEYWDRWNSITTGGWIPDTPVLTGTQLAAAPAC